MLGPSVRSLGAATARGVIYGALGGAAAGLVDHALGAAGARQFLPDGTARLGLFLVGLYGAAAAIAGGAAGFVVYALGEGTDLGALGRSGLLHRTKARPADADGEAKQAVGSRIAAYVVGLLAAFALSGLVIRQATAVSLVRFHSPLLISALVGGIGAATALGAALATFVLASLLSPILRFGPRLGPARGVPIGLLALSWIAGAGVGGAVLARVVFALQQAPRMTPALRALNAGLWAPGLLGATWLAAHLVAWFVLPRLDSSSDSTRPPSAIARLMARPLVSFAAPLALLLVGAIGLGASAWSIVKLLPLQAAAVVAVAVSTALATALLVETRPIPSLLRGPRLVLVVLLPPLFFGLALQAGRADRVLKAAMKHASLAPPFLDGIHAGWDLDRDGYSPVLGPDCNDLDPEIHPGAFDWPDDGIDQNCNGHDATLARPPAPPPVHVPDAVPRTPNVVLISIDALRADHVGAYGYARPTTPRIDELARESVLFKNGWAHSPSTRYSVPAILTGRYESTIAWGSPSEHWPPTVLPENRLLSEMFKDHGYRTAAILPAPYFAPRAANQHMSMWGLDQGFDEYDNSLAHLHSHAGGDPAKATGSSSKQVGDLGVKWIENAAKQQTPYFLWVHFYDPHYLYEKHPEVPSFGDDDMAVYDNEVRFTDLHIGRVLDALRASGQWQNTVVILTADHGEGFGEHGVRQHGYHIYAQQNKVPFLVRVPGVAPRSVDEPVGHVDLWPSLLDILRAPMEPQLFGRSFMDLVLGAPGGKEDPRLVFGEVEFEGPTSRKAVMSRTHQLIDNVMPDGTYEFYDLEHDPAEEHDRFERGAGGEQRRLVEALGEWMDDIALPADFKARVADNLSSQPIATTTPLGARLQSGGAELLVLDGATVPAAHVKRGEEAVIDVVMHVSAPIPRGWHLFTHATSDSGFFLNLDHDPVENFVPLGRLRPGQWVRDRIKFMVPRTWQGSSVTLEMGLYRKSERAKASGGGAAGEVVRAARIVVDP